MENIPGPILAFGIVAGVFYLLMVVVRATAAKIGFGAMAFLSSIGVAADWNGIPQGSWMLPLQEVRSNLFVMVGAALFCALLVHLPRLPLLRTSGQAWFLLIIGLYQGMLRGILEGFTEGMQSLVFTIVTIGTLMFFLPLLLRDLKDWYSLPRVYVFVGLAWLAGAAVQVALNPSKVLMGGEFRFVGIGSNPQLTSAYLATVAIVSMWLVLNDTKRRFRLLWFACTGMCFILVLGTGSRTGTGMMVLGLTMILFRRFGRAALMLPFALLAVLLAYQLTLWLGIELPIHRVLSTEDTRTAVWYGLVQDMLSSPLLGTGLEGTGSENSYLYGGAAFGMGMFALTVLLALYSVWHCLRVFRTVYRYPWLRPIGDLIIAGNVAYFGGSFFEGFILGRVSAMLVFILMIGSMSSALLYAIAHQDELIVGADEAEWDESEELEGDDEEYLPAPTA